ncbi:MAG: hypothetical protein NTY75_02855 [Candidatus Shapirobacteria bacterium]|nr:hypothetical protein [Candidatus Shapirobacteria bacterium]
MNNKLDIKRVLIVDEFGNYFRICGMSNPIDYKGEYYVKVVLPDFKGIPLLAEINGRKGEVVGESRMESDVQEFSYHYKSGVSHFKRSSDNYIDQKTNLPKLSDFNVLHLFRYTIFSLYGFKQFPRSKITDNDLILKDKFVGLPRMLDIAITADPDIHYINVSEHKPLNNYQWDMAEKGVYFSIGDLEFVSIPKKQNRLTELFRYDDPTEYFRGPKSHNTNLLIVKDKFCFYCRKYFYSVFRRSGL